MKNTTKRHLLATVLIMWVIMFLGLLAAGMSGSH